MSDNAQHCRTHLDKLQISAAIRAGQGPICQANAMHSKMKQVVLAEASIHHGIIYICRNNKCSYVFFLLELEEFSQTNTHK